MFYQSLNEDIAYEQILHQVFARDLQSYRSLLRTQYKSRAKLLADERR